MLRCRQRRCSPPKAGTSLKLRPVRTPAHRRRRGEGIISLISLLRRSELHKCCMILIAITSSCASEPCRSRFSLRKEGEVAWLESPNGLGATAEFQLRGKVSSLNFLRFSAVRPSTHSDNDSRLRRLLIVRFVTDSSARPGAPRPRGRARRENPRRVPVHHSYLGRLRRLWGCPRPL